MSLKDTKLIKRSLIILVLAVLVYGINYLWGALPIITGYSAKMACSCLYLSNRELASIKEQELGSFPLKLATISVNHTDSVVTASVFGLARQRALFRSGLGCTLVNGLSEAAIREQPIRTIRQSAYNQDSVDWPMGDRLPGTIPAAIDPEKMQLAIAYAFDEKERDHLWRTRSVVVLYNGELVGERYAPGFNLHTPQLSWSMAKSVTGALVGILVGLGKLQVDQPAPVPEWRNENDGRQNIRLENLLQQASGLDFEENYAKLSDATKMLFRQADMGAYTASRPIKDSPGSSFYYTSGNTNILSRIIRHTVGEKDYHSFPSKALFRKIGMQTAIMEPDASGSFVGSSYTFASARDWARFGLLYANDGIWRGEQILPAGWVKASSTPGSAAPQGEYGYQFWLNAGAPGVPSNRRFPQIPADMYYADGYEGQFVFIVPSKKLVVVRLGQTAGDNFDAGGFLKGIIDAIN